MKGLERKEPKYTLEQVLPFITLGNTSGSRKYGQDRMNMSSARLKTFAFKGTKCVVCGIEGQYFVKERNASDPSSKRENKYHFNLYAVDADGKEVLMTKDHIIPKSRGGSEALLNFQPMCFLCNHEKGNRLREEERVVVHVDQDPYEIESFRCLRESFDEREGAI